jgi:hypothetical protein
MLFKMLYQGAPDYYAVRKGRDLCGLGRVEMPKPTTTGIELSLIFRTSSDSEADTSFLAP